MEKGKTVGNTSVLGCRHSLSQLKRIRKFASRIDEENEEIIDVSTFENISLK